jgi:L,D-transpeptidase catalytic domain
MAHAARRLLLAATIACFAMIALSACQRSPAAPVASQVIDPSGDRIELPIAEPLSIQVRDQASHRVKSLLNVSGQLNYGDYVWNERGVPPGPIWVVVDLSEQTLSVFRGDNEIGTTVLLYGTDDTPTPTGRFTVLAMSKDHWSNTYNAPMPYTLRLTTDGVSIHGSHVQPRAGTHGCLGVPIDFAKRLFAVANVGDEVLITRNASSSAKSV